MLAVDFYKCKIDTYFKHEVALNKSKEVFLNKVVYFAYFCVYAVLGRGLSFHESNHDV